MDPLGGTQICKDWGAGAQFKVCQISCQPGLRFSEPVPEFYTCGAEGFWRPTSNPSQQLTYPSCSRQYFFFNRYYFYLIKLLYFVYSIKTSPTCVQNSDVIPI